MRFDDKTRRDVMIGALAAAGATAAAGRMPAFASVRSEIASGTVFADDNGDGIRRSSSRGLPGVLVSNGREIVATDRDGHWYLPLRDGEHIFVVTPSGWSQPPHGPRPGVSYWHRPFGSPSQVPRRFGGSSPTGALPARIDFALCRTPDPTSFEVALVADTQPADQTELSYVRDAVLSSVAATKAAFAIHHGDVMGDDLGLLDRYLGLLTVTGMPWHHCPGNHDMNLDCPDGSAAFETWQDRIGPTHYAFQHGRATFIILNNVEYFGARPRAGGGRGYRGAIGSRQLAFVANVLRHIPRDHLVSVSMHIPLVSFDDPRNPADTTADRRALLALLSSHPHTVSFAGHSHTTEHHFLGSDEGFLSEMPHHHHVLTAACGSWWSGPHDHRGIPVSLSRDGSPKGFHVLSVEGQAYATRFVSCDVDQSTAQMRIVAGCCGRPNESGDGWLLGGRIGSGDLAHAAVLVDVFDGGPRTHVTLEIEGVTAAPLAMARTGACNPYVVDFFARHAESCKPWVAASRSSHLWSVPLPADLQPAAYRLRAVARGADGREHTAHLILEVTA